MATPRVFSYVLVNAVNGEGKEEQIVVAAIPRTGVTITGSRAGADRCVVYASGLRLFLHAAMRDVVEALEAGDDVVVRGYEIQHVLFPTY